MNQRIDNSLANHVVIWSVFNDSYITIPINCVSPAIDFKCIGTKNECDSWISFQK